MGGGLFQDAGVLSVLNSKFTANGSHLCRALLFGGTTFTVTGTTFNENRATSFGGAVIYQNPSTWPGLQPDR